MDRQLSLEMVQHIEHLVDASYSGRDELYAAADSLDDQKRQNVCRQLAQHLAQHATELQQLLVANGEDPLEPLDLYSIAENYFGLIKSREGEAGVLSVAEECERTVKERFEEVLNEAAASGDTAAILQRQLDDIEFGEHVLRTMREPPQR